VAIFRSYAYVATEYGLKAINISDPANPRDAVVASTEGASGVGVSEEGNYACVAAGGFGLQVFDITSPGVPVWRGGYDTRGDAQDVAVSGNYAYVADGQHGLQVIDIDLTKPGRPLRVGGNAYFRAYGVTVHGGKVFVAAGFDGLVILDVFRPYDLKAMPVTSSGVFRLQVGGPRNVPVCLQRSVNLVDWEDWRCVTPADGAVEVSDPAFPSAQRRFYRVVP
jgi:hypothetical protein